MIESSEIVAVCVYGITKIKHQPTTNPNKHEFQGENKGTDNEKPALNPRNYIHWAKSG